MLGNRAGSNRNFHAQKLNRFPGLILWMVGLWLVWAPAPVQAGLRTALVVGISQYEAVPKLKNTIRDGKLLAETLRGLDFSVTELYEADKSGFLEALARFENQSETADVSIVYFAGHGIEFAGVNYLLPVDIAARRRQDIANGSITLDQILTAVDKARQLRIVILDSCRDDPFVQISGQKTVTLSVNAVPAGGLAEPSPERGTLVAFAAKAGATALDGVAANSPYALALANHFATPDLEIGLMFRRVRDEVLRTTGNQQEPHTYGSISGVPFFLAGVSKEVERLEKDARRFAWNRISIDHEKSLRKLALEGDTRSLKALAYMQLDPDGEKYNPKEAIELLRQAIDKGDPEAMFELAKLLEKGIGTDQNIEEALALYRKAAGLEFPDAINDLGFLHYLGAEGVPKDVNKALGFFERAARLGHPEAMYNFAALIDDGLVDGKSSEDAAELLFRALRSGNEEVLKILSDNPNMFKAPARVALQRKLKDANFYTGSLDGQFGPLTRRSLKKAYGIETE